MTAIQTHVKTMVFVKTELMTTHVIAILDSLEITVKHVRMHYPLVSEYHIKLQNECMTQMVSIMQLIFYCLDIDDCNSSPCQNSGICNDEIDGYSCSCESGFMGENCEISNTYNTS